MQFRDLPKQDGLTLDALRQLLPMARVTVVSLEGGYAIRYDVSRGRTGFLLSDHTREVRGFARADTAIKLCRQLGLKRVEFELGAAPAVLSSEAA